MPKSITYEITVTPQSGTFSVFRKQGISKKDFDFSGISDLRKILSNEKARILQTIKTNHPNSIYSLAKILNRTFKSVYRDLKLLEKFGFVEFIKEKTKKRTRYKPVLVVDTINFTLRF